MIEIDNHRGTRVTRIQEKEKTPFPIVSCDQYNWVEYAKKSDCINESINGGKASEMGRRG